MTHHSTGHKKLESAGWKKGGAPFIIVDNQKANIIGRNILPQIEIRLKQEKPKHGNVVIIREQEQSNPEFKHWVKDNYPQLCIRVGKSKKSINADPIQRRINSGTAERTPCPGSSTKTSRKKTQQTHGSKTHNKTG